MNGYVPKCTSDWKSVEGGRDIDGGSAKNISFHEGTLCGDVTRRIMWALAKGRPCSRNSLLRERYSRPKSQKDHASIADYPDFSFLTLRETVKRAGKILNTRCGYRERNEARIRGILEQTTRGGL